MPQDMERGDGFGMLLRRYRSVAGLTQEELAQQSGLSVRALSNMERGRTDKPYARSVRLIADALGLTGHERAKLLDAWHGRDTSEAIAAGPPGGSGAVARQPVMPRQLPAAVPHFVGRHRELKELDSLLDQACGQSTGTVVVSAIGGTAGVGKTALALHWAHRVAGRYPDGQLYVNLRGYDPAPPVAAADALAGFLRALGVPGQEVPAEMDERAGLFRSLLAGRRMLVILDNAHGADQVRPLLPGTSTCTALVTSRDSMAGLVARDGALRVELDLLPLADAVAVLGELIGERAHTEPRAAAALAEQCSRLPLALRVAAELAAARPATTVG
ncbi:MAG TPA: helix-turn-helix domain-containing protein, partial [Streptosporangiaceae bacterium]|nr:helix-turn-helix domain-containing protein [Streptosporangiaceae bacterium]